MADIKVSWVAFDTAATPCDVKVSWVALDTAATPCDVKVSWVCFDTDAQVQSQVYGRGKRSRKPDDLTREEVEAQWDLLEVRLRGQETPRSNDLVHAAVSAVSAVSVAPKVADVADVAESASVLAIAAAKRRRQEEELLMLLFM